MAYDEHFAERVSRVLKEKKVDYTSKKMMGGFLFMVDQKMLCGMHINKKFGDSLLMCRIGEEVYVEELKKEVCLPMDFTGRPMKGFIYVTPDGFDLDSDLEYWIQLCLDYNPIAKASPSKRKSKKK